MKTSYIQLGATLFIPASHKHLNAIVSEEKHKDLKSLVIDFEDGLEDSAFSDAMKNIDTILQKINKKSPLVFLRAKDEHHLKVLLTLKHIENINGFVLAKFSLFNATSYLNSLQNRDFLIMPSIEGQELFNHQKLHELKDIILTNKQNVLLVRFGLEDMLRQLRLRRECTTSVFDLSTTSAVLGNFIATFKSVGFGVSGGVYPCFNDEEGFIKDVERDLKEGLFSKTIIHPKHIALVNRLYRVSKKEYDEAKAIVDSPSKLFNQNEKMAEVVTMSAHSQEILVRASVYGIA